MNYSIFILPKKYLSIYKYCYEMPDTCLNCKNPVNDHFFTRYCQKCIRHQLNLMFTQKIPKYQHDYLVKNNQINMKYLFRDILKRNLFRRTELTNTNTW